MDIVDLYVLTANTYEDSYGSEITLFGVFDTEEKAIERMEELKKEHKFVYMITKVMLNESTNMYLGGYYE